MNDFDRLRARILEQRAEQPEPRPERTSNTLMSVLLVSLALAIIFAVAAKFL